MRTFIYNGKIYQGNHDYCESLLIEDEKIIGVNTNDFNAEQIIDLKGKTVIPGLNDSHMHLFNLAQTYAQADIRDCKSKKELIDTCIEYCKNHPEYVTKGFYARGFNNDYFVGDQSMPTRYDLDTIFYDLPVVLSRVCGHQCSVNTKVLEMLDEIYGLDNLPKEEVQRDENNNPTGVLYEFSVMKAYDLIPSLDKEIEEELVLKAMNYCASVGLTSIQSNDLNDFVKETNIKEILVDLYKNKKAPIKYCGQCCFSDYDSYKNTLENDNYHFDYEDHNFKIGPLKLYKDGSLGARSAELYDDYKDDPGNKGIQVNTLEEIEKYTKLSNEYDIQVVTHSIGDKAIDEVAQAYINANKDNQNKNRHGIIHCQITNQSILEKIVKNNLYIFYQPIFIEYDLHMVESRVGKELAMTSYAFETARKLGIHSSFGSDCPIEDCNGFYNLHSAINRQDLERQPQDGFNPKEKMSIEDAVDAFTIESSYASFEEKEKGLLQPGYYADLLILDQDIFTIDSSKIKDMKPFITMVNGKIVFKSDINK